MNELNILKSKVHENTKLDISEKYKIFYTQIIKGFEYFLKLSIEAHIPINIKE